MKGEPRMEGSKEKTSNCDHSAIKHHKIDLIVPELPMKATSQLGDSEARADEDDNCSNQNPCICRSISATKIKIERGQEVN